jgi:predicted RNase H-like HicB family nuclease
VPDLPGCVAVEKSVAEVKRLIVEAIDFHLEGLQLSEGRRYRSRPASPNMSMRTCQ